MLIRIIITAILIASFAGCSFNIFRSSLPGEKAITPQLIAKHINFLASDSLKGRNTPSPELDSAAEYIAKEFHSIGLSPVNDSYFQKLNLCVVKLDKDNHLKISKDRSEKLFQIKEEFTPFEMTGNKETNASVIFAGYGIDAPEYNYSDYSNIDVAGKIVFVLRHEPGEEDTNSVFDGVKSTAYSNVPRKVKTAIEKGAVGVLVATDPLNHTSLTPRGFPWPSLSKTIPEDALPMNLSMDESKKIPVVHVGEEVINLLFGNVDSLKNLQSEIDASFTSQSFQFENVSVNLKTTTIVTEKPARNVVGFLEGSDPVLKNEGVVIGAHCDHVGYKKKHEPDTDYIFNGADDNASGTSGVLAIAAAFTAMKTKPKRSVMFLTFAGEEKGLLGSEAYVENPLFSLEKTVVMLNLDMIGRNHEDTLFIIGSSRSPDVAAINAEENSFIGFTLAGNEERYVGGSDHASFMKKKVPALFYHTGTHADYHKVTDHADLIDMTKAAKVSQLAFRTAWRLANENK
ncbi:MAG: M20/M25/M40 family metallo-hydrolase [Bacteroidota bacterium]|nr:M20/M25/M40 family metallo-hydrolase [Bacteroidota bacterium]